MDFLALKQWKLCRMARYAHGLNYSRLFLLYNCIDLLKKCYELVMNLMVYVAINVLGPRLVSLSVLKPSRQPNHPEEEHLSFEHIV